MTTAAMEPRRPSWDGVTALLLMTLFALACAVASFLGLMLAFTSDSCTNACSTGLITFGMAVTGFGPWVVFFAAGTWAVLRRVRGQAAWWVPMIGIVVGVCVALTGIALAFAGAS